MTNAPPQGSPGAPHLSYSNPTSDLVPRRSSYASVAAGTASAPHQTASVHLPRTVNTSSYTQRTSAEQPSRLPQPIPDTDAQDGGIIVPPLWGKGVGSMANFSSPRFPSQNYGAVDNGATAGFFKPTYLENTMYMEKLEAAYEASLATQRDESTTRSSNLGSLSNNSSTASLPKMQVSHRGMAYEIIEHQPQVEDVGPTPLPSRWAETDKHGSLEIGADGQEIRYVGLSKLPEHEAASARSDHPMPIQCGIYYYEVTVNSKGKDGMVAIGFSSGKSSLEKLPGWEAESWAYHGDDGKTFCCQLTGKPYSQTFTSGDIIGCGVNFMTGCAFFTKNGNHLGPAFRDIKDTTLYPSVGMKRPHAHLTVNFGQHPFFFQIDRHVKLEKESLLRDIASTNVRLLHPTWSKRDLCKALVAQYLSHDGYVETAKAFAEEVRGEAMTLRGSSDPSLDRYLAMEEDHDAVNRQRIRTAILDGDIDETLKLTTTFYPRVLQDNPQIYFRLRCRKFLEMVRHSSELLHAPVSKAPKSTNGHPNAIPDDEFEPDMDLDEPMKDGDDWEKMDTEEADNGMKYEAFIASIIQYGAEIKNEFKDDKSRPITETLSDIYGLLAYKDARQSPKSHLLDPSQRIPVAEALNSAILVFLGKSSTTALERVYKQTVVLVDMISEEGGPGCLTNVRKLLRDGRS